MAVTHPTTAHRNSLADLIVDLLDTGTPPAKLIFQTAADATVATLTFANPAFGAAGATVAARADANPIISDSSAVGGTISKFEIRQGNATPVIRGSVTATGGGGDITLNSVTITAAQTVSITSMTYTAPL